MTLPRQAAARAGLGLALGLAFGCGHAIAPGIPFQHAPRFDFLQPPECARPAAPPPAMPDAAAGDAVVVRYLGAGGVLVQWRGEALLAAPFFSDPGMVRSVVGRIRWDRAAIARGLAGVATANVGAILAGHSHYDHLGDLPVVAEAAPRAALLVNRSGANALLPFRELVRRASVLETMEDRSTQLVDAAGRALPFRLRPVASRHAPHLGPIGLWMGTTRPSLTPWPQRRWGSLKSGKTYAFVLDLTDGTAPEGRVRFRFFLQDAAAAAPHGIPPAPAAGEPSYDVAVVCVASSQFARSYPEDLLRRIAPRHVLVTHYEDFFRPWGPRRRFVPLLTQGVADRFLRRVDGTLAALGIAGSPPASPPCGPSAPRWTMPLTGERLRFQTATEVATTNAR